MLDLPYLSSPVESAGASLCDAMNDETHDVDPQEADVPRYLKFFEKYVKDVSCRGTQFAIR